MITLLAHIGTNLTFARESVPDIYNDHVFTFHNDENELVGLRWPKQLNDEGVYQLAKRKKGLWNGEFWDFPSVGDASEILASLKEKFSTLNFMDISEIVETKSPEIKNEYAVMPISRGLVACILTKKISYLTPIEGLLSKQYLFEKTINEIQIPADVYKAVDLKDNKYVVVCADDFTIEKLIEGIVSAGAIENRTLISSFNTESSIKIKTKSWAVEISLNLSNPLHWPLIKYGNLSKDSWHKVSTTRSKFSKWKQIIDEAGLKWEGDDPDVLDLSVPANFDESKVKGWNTPAPNGYLLHDYQKEGAQFCASRGMRALIGDEMGVGKTVQAIAAAEATSAKRIVIICPANARFVWEKEIQAWGSHGRIQHIESQMDKLDTQARWHILTYDVLSTRAQTWSLYDDTEVNEFVQTFPDFAKSKDVINGKFPRKITLNEPLNNIPKFNDNKRTAAWKKMMQRMNNDLSEQIKKSVADSSLVILDEAHRVKNRSTKRTKAVQQIANNVNKLIMLTGTPVRNREDEAAVLLSLLDPDSGNILNRNNGYHIQDVKDYLAYFMIRRTKQEVLPDLPKKTRQRVDIENLDENAMLQYYEAMDLAQFAYMDGLRKGFSKAAARQNMQGFIEKARSALGTAKVLGGVVTDLVLDVVENKECCVVFCAHNNASDELKLLLEKNELKVAIIDGRVPAKNRAKIVDDFQEGQLDVLICGINAAGEAITLTRADTVIFVELDWVPAALMQAEDRIHRVGQKSNCQVIQLVARTRDKNLDEIMIELIGKKMEVIGSLLDEDKSNIIARSTNVIAELQDVLLSEVKSVVETKHENHLSPEAIIMEEKTTTRRGRPKLYTDQAPPTSTERSKKSIKALSKAGGKRVMLRLSPEAHDALRSIMEITGVKQETSAINLSLIERLNDLLHKSTLDT